MRVIDKDRVRRSFGRQAHQYDSHTDVQKRVVGRLLEIIAARAHDINPGRILDMGAGTGMLLSRLPGMYPGVASYGIDLAPEMSLVARRKMKGRQDVHLLSADVEQLPFADGVFDLVLSTSTFQWLNTLGHAFSEAFRVLAPGGSFCFALFGESTLFELKNSYRLALESSGKLPEDKTHNFRNDSQVREALVRAGFTGCFAAAEMHVEYHENVPALLRSLKNIGAGNAAPVPGNGLAGRTVIGKMIEIYADTYRGNGLIPATYEVVYAGGIKSS